MEVDTGFLPCIPSIRIKSSIYHNCACTFKTLSFVQRMHVRRCQLDPVIVSWRKSKAVGIIEFVKGGGLIGHSIFNRWGLLQARCICKRCSGIEGVLNNLKVLLQSNEKASVELRLLFQAIPFWDRPEPGKAKLETTSCLLDLLYWRHVWLKEVESIGRLVFAPGYSLLREDNHIFCVVLEPQVHIIHSHARSPFSDGML